MIPRHMPAGASVPSCQVVQRERLDKEQSPSPGAESAKGSHNPPPPPPNHCSHMAGLRMAA